MGDEAKTEEQEGLLAETWAWGGSTVQFFLLEGIGFLGSRKGDSPPSPPQPSMLWREISVAARRQINSGCTLLYEKGYRTVIFPSLSGKPISFVFDRKQGRENNSPNQRVKSFRHKIGW